MADLAAGLLATIVSAALADYFWMEPVGQFGITNSADLLSMAVFLASGALISYLAEATYRAQARAHKAEEQSRLAAEREKAAVELQQSESKYRELVQNANSAIIRWKRDGTIAFFNEYAQKFFGYSAEEVIGKSVNILVPEQESTGGDLSGLLQDIVNHPERYANNINENVLRDGSRVWMAWTNRPIFDEDGQVLEILAVGSDITERKRAEVLLRRQAELLHLSYDAIIVWPLGGGIESWNRGAEELYGYSKEEAEGRVTLDLLKTIHPEPWAQIEARLRERKFWEGEIKHRTHEGREVIISARLQLVPGADGVERVLEINRDITERKHAEARLTADLAALTRMHALSGRLLETGGIQPLLQEIMDAAVSIAGAKKGTLQLLEGDSLRIVAAHGHKQPFLEFFASAESQASVCGEATRRGERVVVSDVETSALFIGTPSLAVLREAGVRAVQSTPVMSRNGALLGILTTQWGGTLYPR